MPSQVSDEQLGDALLQSAERGAFPQDEHVASAAVPPSALPKLLEVVNKAREDTKVCKDIWLLSRFLGATYHSAWILSFLADIEFVTK